MTLSDFSSPRSSHILGELMRLFVCYESVIFCKRNEMEKPFFDLFSTKRIMFVFSSNLFPFLLENNMSTDIDNAAKATEVTILIKKISSQFIVNKKKTFNS